MPETVKVECTLKGPKCEGYRYVFPKYVKRTKYCPPCSRQAQAESNKRGKQNPSERRTRKGLEDPNVLVASGLTSARLKIECAKPLLRIAIQRNNWDLVVAALDELEHDNVPVIDLRHYAPVPTTDHHSSYTATRLA